MASIYEYTEKAVRLEELKEDDTLNHCGQSDSVDRHERREEDCIQHERKN